MNIFLRIKPLIHKILCSQESVTPIISWGQCQIKPGPTGSTPKTTYPSPCRWINWSSAKHERRPRSHTNIRPQLLSLKCSCCPSTLVLIYTWRFWKTDLNSHSKQKHNKALPILDYGTMHCLSALARHFLTKSVRHEMEVKKFSFYKVLLTLYTMLALKELWESETPKNCPWTSKNQCQEVWDSQFLKIFSHLWQKFRMNLCVI